MKNLKTIGLGFLITYLSYLAIYHLPIYRIFIQWQGDKIFHFVGGYLIASLLCVVLKIKNLYGILLGVFFVGILWEFSEALLLQPWMLFRYSNLDPAIFSWGDMSANMIGGITYYLINSFEADDIAIEGVRSTE